MMNAQYVITTISKEGQAVKSDLWNSAEPFVVGYPLRWVFEKIEKGFRVRDLKKGVAQEVSESKTLSEGSHVKIEMDSITFRIHSTRVSKFESGWTPRVIPTMSFEMTGPTSDFEFFRRSMLGSMGILAVLTLISIVIPARKQEETLVPPQFAKIILAPPSGSRSESMGNHADSSDNASAKTVNLVKTFQSAQVKRSTQNLLKGGVLALLSRSDLLSGARHKNALNALFEDKQRNALNPSALNAAPKLASLQVGALGGKGGGSANTVGYGDGTRAGVAGQGQSYVKLDSLDALVDEGLTKDEVGKVIHSHIAEVRYCYESAMIKNPDVQGKLIINFVIEGKGSPGSVKTAKINSSTIGDSLLDQCILSRLVKWKFPNPRGGVEVAVAYPFVFKSLGK